MLVQVRSKRADTMQQHYICEKEMASIQRYVSKLLLEVMHTSKMCIPRSINLLQYCNIVTGKD